MEQIGAKFWSTTRPPASPSSFTPLDTAAVDLTSDQINAGWFIIVVIGFFAFIIISSMAINQLHAEPVEDDVIADYLQTQCQNNKKSTKSSQETSICYDNQAYTDSYTSTTSGTEHYRERGKNVDKTKRDDTISTADQNVVICISDIP